ncbi:MULTISPECIES: aliphatic sulfonate ABC transporter substrate-binding protein [Enterobacterales]|jgi:sulfonate transport system substrate-binding protein|uniref:aliphatic sulfonate ABC transporter substrate-binding protein n=1 Tax=Enterobacterales TaxID=91347 RepID=UPI0015C9697D|nr:MULTISPECIES: aliphatic sulfonate ABC transporter substrate-binding protein [Enterobacterales]MBB3303506.1 sulfonate transport system substrate-binding protein [Enterobacter sp. Sphag1F]NYI13390.1 sulfonate transport system substrate-binding protein [Enterobacter sp. Sphag71]
MKITLLACSLLLLTVTSQAASNELIVGDQKGNARAVMSAAGELNNVPYEIKWYEFPNAAPLLESLNSQHLDAGLVGDGPLSFAVAAGAQIRAIQASQYLGNAIVVKKDSALHSIADLKGKKVATVKGSAGQNMVLNALHEAGLPDDSVSFVFTTPSEATLALDNGAVDAVATWEPYVSFAVAQSGDRIAIDGKNSPVSNYLVATDSAIASKREQLADFRQRLIRARAWGVAHPQAYASEIAKLLRLPDAVALSKVQRENNAPVEDYALVEKRQQLAIDTFTRGGLIKPGLKADKLVDASFFNANGAAKP